VLFVCVVEDDGDGRLVDVGLSLLVDELLERLRADAGQVGDAHHEAEGVQDVGLACGRGPGSEKGPKGAN